jgi:5'(3')-deoxyribonucleotidase
VRIAVDFDDVVADTMYQFLAEWNNKFPRQLKREDITSWDLPRLLGVQDDLIRGVYEDIDYELVEPLRNAVYLLNRLDNTHDVLILSANRRERDMRKWLNEHGLSHIPLHAGIGHKAGFVREYEVDVLVEDRPSYLKGAVTVGVHAIRFAQNWNKMPAMWGEDSVFAELEHEAFSWVDVYAVIDEIDAEMQAKMRAEIFGIETVSANARGGKQTNLEARYDLLPPLALQEVAKVLHQGAEKYGPDNWKLLSIQEINNHTLGHLINYETTNGDVDDLSHAACRALMALQLALENGG